MKSIILELVQQSDSAFQWQFINQSGELLLETQPFDFTVELNAMVRSFLSDPRADNAKRLSAELAKTFSTEAELKQTLGRICETDDVFIYLRLPESMGHVPWELVKTSSTGPSLSSLYPTARLTTESTNASSIRNQCILVSPSHLGAVRDKTLYSSTRRLARKHHVDIVELEPPTLSTLRRITKSGNLLIHFEGIRGDRLPLDDGLHQVSRVLGGEPTWCVVLGGTEGCLLATQELEQRNVLQSIGRSFGVDTRTQAIFERSFYHALADGDSIGTAVLRARHNVEQSDALLSFQAAAYVLSVAEQPTPADQTPFPPKGTRLPSPLNLSDALVVERLRYPLKNLHEPPAHPMPLSLFIQESIQVLRSGLESEDERNARRAVLKRLASRHAMNREREPLPHDAAALRRYFEDLVGADDTDLPAIQGRNEQITALSQYAGVKNNATLGIIHALRSCEILHIRSSDLEQARTLVRGVAESIYGFCPRLYSYTRNNTFFDGPRLNGPERYHAGGEFARILASHWRRDESTSLQPEQARPTIRLPSIGRIGSIWHVFKGTWLVIEIDETWNFTDEQKLLRALQSKSFDGLNAAGSPFRLAVPRDFRIILLSSQTAEIQSQVPMIGLDENQTSTFAGERWAASIAKTFGPPSGLTDIKYRAKFIEKFTAVFLRLQLLHPITVGEGQRILGTAFSMGGHIDHAIGSAIRILYGRSTAAKIESSLDAESCMQLIEQAARNSVGVNERLVNSIIELLESINGEPLPNEIVELAYTENAMSVLSAATTHSKGGKLRASAKT